MGGEILRETGTAKCCSTAGGSVCCFWGSDLCSVALIRTFQRDRVKNFDKPWKVCRKFHFLFKEVQGGLRKFKEG
jgi:hypothetical protein